MAAQRYSFNFNPHRNDEQAYRGIAYLREPYKHHQRTDLIQP